MPVNTHYFILWDNDFTGLVYELRRQPSYSFYNEFKLHVLSKPQMFLTKFNDKYEVCCHGDICASALPTSFKARYVILNAYKKTGYVDMLFAKFAKPC